MTYKNFDRRQIGPGGSGSAHQMEDIAYEMRTGLSKRRCWTSYRRLRPPSSFLRYPDRRGHPGCGKRLKVVGGWHGVDNIDVEAATRHGSGDEHAPRQQRYRLNRRWPDAGCFAPHCRLTTRWRRANGRSHSLWGLNYSRKRWGLSVSGISRPSGGPSRPGLRHEGRGVRPWCRRRQAQS